MVRIYNKMIESKLNYELTRIETRWKTNDKFTSVDFGIIQKSGSWFSYKEDKIGQGKENVKAFLERNPDLCQEIEALVKEKLKGDNAENTEE